MSILYGDTGKVSIGTYKQVDFNYPFIESNPIAVDLPLTSPVTPQITFVLDETIMPTVSVNNATFIPIPYIVAGGKNGANTAIIYYEVYRNGVLWQSGNKTNVTINQFWTFCFFKYDTTFCKVGDTFDVKLWANVTGVSYYYNTIMVFPSRNDFGIKEGTILKDITYGLTRPSNFLQGVGGSLLTLQWTGSFYIMPSNMSSSFAGGSSDYTVPILSYANTQYKLGILQGGDYPSGTQAIINVHETDMPRLTQNSIPLSVSFREVCL